jgi:hypothetical protein
MMAQIKSPESLRSHSMQYAPPEARSIDFGDDQNVNYSDEKVKVKRESRHTFYLR